MKKIVLLISYLKAELSKLFGKTLEKRDRFKSKRSFEYSEEEMTVNINRLMTCHENSLTFVPPRFA